MSVTVIIDGKRVEAEPGALLIDVCRENGIDIPHFCYHPGLGPDGNCRMCQVEFISERGNRVAVSCKATVADGMEVRTDSEAAKAARASVEEFLLLNHPLDCPICDKAGECTLQNYYMEHDLQESRQTFTRFKKEKARDIGPTLILDQERCVLCDRCVRFLAEVAGDPQLYIAGRGHEAYITTFPGQEVTSPYSLNTVDLCPVGALTAKDFRFASPTWYLKNTPSVCTTCARGCSFQIQGKDGKIRRMRPRHNPDVNGYWACDEGRLNYKYVNENRITSPRLRRGDEVFEASQEEAIAEMRKVLGFAPAGKVEDSGGGADVFIMASCSCTLEEFWQLKKLAAGLNAPLVAVRHVPDGIDDNLLRRADKHPNTKGAELLGIDVVDLQGEGATPPEGVGGDTVLLAVGFNGHVGEGVLAAAEKSAAVVALSACETELTRRADLVVPGLTFAEKDGLVVNFEGHVQRLRIALDPAPGARSEWIVLERLMASLDGGKGTEFISAIRRAIAEGEAAFGGLDLVNVGATGVRVSAQTVG
jgi:NADH-quinone oxidoreductase subunit G